MDGKNSGRYINKEALADLAAAWARSYTEERRPARYFRQRLRRLYAQLDERVTRLSDEDVSSSGREWLLDNFYLVRREYRAAEGDARLWADGGALLFDLCRELVRTGETDEERCRLFLAGVQTVTELPLAALRAFPLYLRLALIESIAEESREPDAPEAPERLRLLFASLRLFPVLDADRLTESVCPAAAILRRDPTGEFAHMDDATRRSYLDRLETLAKKRGMGETELAAELIERAERDGCHVGSLLFEEKKRHGAGAYVAANVLVTLLLSLWAAFATGQAVNALLLLFPLWELVKSFTDWLLLRLVKPRSVPRMDTDADIPPEGRTLCVKSVLLTDADGARAAVRSLEELYLSARAGRELTFGLLADLKAAPQKETPEDAAILAAAREAVDALNRRYGSGFYLFTRERGFDGQLWTGHERKRGALLELARLLCDKESALQITGERDALVGTRYILTLDADTVPYPGALRQLIGAMLHPLCRPVLDRERGIVTAGRAILHPRISNELTSAFETDFAICFSGGGGSDPYGGLSAELYMDAFASGGFAGKGILDAEALLLCSEKQLPEGRILSHDALEGAFLRGGYIGDVEFFDSFPSKPVAYFKRLHRWVRGDWQNAPWLFRRGRQLPAIERFRLFDSLRRSITPPMTLLALVCGLLVPGLLRAAAWAALLSMTARIFVCLAELRSRPRPRLRRHTHVLSGVGGAIVQSFLRLWLLPYEAWVCAGAIVTALWRMLVSHKKLLEWETAAQAGGSDGGLGLYLRKMWLPMLVGSVLLVFSAAVIGKAAGLLWLLSPLCAAALALPAARDTTLSRRQREFLLDCAKRTWSYFETLCTPEDNFLPPDNFQLQPPVGIAHRTSPTNIGFAAASAVAAADMELIPRERAAAFIAHVTDTLERLPRFRGHFLNWYDTRTLRPLRPAFVSTVDSGNLYAALTVCREALTEWGLPHEAERIEKLLRGMDFSPLYDERRELFSIGMDAESGQTVAGVYDLLASEARLTSYVALAKGDAPVRHWRRLGRAQLQKDGYRGCASWTGTMFEYLMPELFLPLYPSGLLYESAKFCMYVQKKRVPAGEAWGVSESAFFELDPELSYRYKAHGCAELALKRGQDRELVVAPYASFLALSVEPQAAISNLHRLEGLGASCRFGYIEALDFTKRRTRGTMGEKVECCMAHHEGMTLLSLANALCGGSIVRRFMADPAMSACRTLLCERVGDDAGVLRRDRSPEPERQPRPLRRWERTSGGDEEAACLLSNGVYSLRVSADGVSSAAAAGKRIYTDGRLLRFEADGIKAKAPEKAVFSEDCAVFSYSAGKLSARETVSVAAFCPGELRSVELCAAEDVSLKLCLTFEPVLADAESYAAHPAFWRLGLHARELDGMLCLRRLRREGARELWLCLASTEKLNFSADRYGGLGFLSAPLVRAEVKVKLHAGETRELRFALCMGLRPDEAAENARRTLADPTERGSMASSAAARLGMSVTELDEAMDAVYELWHRRVLGACPKSELWKYGVSGDLPIVCCDDGERAEGQLRRLCLLKSCGLDYDLVLLSSDGGRYDRPFYRRVLELLSAYGLEALLGARGGVHLLPTEAKDAVLSRRQSPFLPLCELATVGTARDAEHPPEYAWDNDLRFTVCDSLPARAWQLPLTNGRFGYLATDAGTGFLWHGNAHECPITPYRNDPYAVRGAEQLAVSYCGELYSLFAANDGCTCRVSFTPGAAQWEKQIGENTFRVTAFVPTEADARVLLVECPAPTQLFWQMPLCLGADPACVRVRCTDGVLRAVNGETHFSVCTGVPDAPFFTGYAPAAFSLTLRVTGKLVLACGCCDPDALASLCQEDRALAALNGTVMAWREKTRVKISTGNAKIDRYLRSWCAYQCIAGRLYARTSLYQQGGAYGFRDQLQDAVNLLSLDSSYAHDAILRACRHQYREGDVMHWWHEKSGGDLGVRTRCSDDLLWLVWAVCRYAESVSTDILHETAPFLASPPLSEGEHDRCETPPETGSASVLDHARAAMECFMARPHGAHGLPLFGSGDWNDGLSAVGGESVWLGWFGSCCADGLAALCSEERYTRYAEALGHAADACRGEGYYLRGFTEDGEPLGGAGHIDSIAQSWAVFCRYGDRAFAEKAVRTALDRLVDEKNGLVRLFDPPFFDERRSPGYIEGYGPGFRENGGQYTHGALWLARACLLLGLREEGMHVMELVLPQSHEPRRYQSEPNVLAADIYAAPGHEGEAGWSWYTGSAGWFLSDAALTQR